MYDFDLRSNPPACTWFLSTGNCPFYHLLPQVVLSLSPPTLSISCYLMNTLPPPTLRLAGQIHQIIPASWNSCSIPVSLSALSPCRLDPDPTAFTSQILQLLTPCFELFCLLGSSLSLPVWVRWAMKIPLWCLVVLLACLFTPGCSDCQGQCMACGLLLQQQQLEQTFNTMVSTCVYHCNSVWMHVNTAAHVCSCSEPSAPWWGHDGDPVSYWLECLCNASCTVRWSCVCFVCSVM